MKTKVVSKWSGGDLAWQVWHKYLYALSIPSLFFLFTRTSSAGRHTLVFLLQTCFLVCAYFPPSLVVVSTFLMTHHQGKRAVKSNPTFFYLATTIPSPFLCVVYPWKVNKIHVMTCPPYMQKAERGKAHSKIMRERVFLNN